MTKFLISVHIVFSVLVVLVFVAGLLLPRRREAQKTEELGAVPEEIWDLVTDHAGQLRWRTDLEKVELVEQNDDCDMWTEYPKRGAPLTFMVRKKIPHSCFETASVNPASIKCQRAELFEYLGKGNTRVTFIEREEIRNPFMRVLAHLYIDPAENINQYLRDLNAGIREKNERTDSQTS